MKKAKGKRESIRMSLDLSPAGYERIGMMAEKFGGNKSEVMRRALALMDIVLRETGEGMHIGVAKDSKQLDKEFIIL